MGRRLQASQLEGDNKAALDSLSLKSSTEEEGGGDSSKVLGTNTQSFNPKASLAFLHLLPISDLCFTSKQE